MHLYKNNALKTITETCFGPNILLIKPPGGLNVFYWYQIFSLDFAVVEVQEMFSSHGGHLTNAMYPT